MAAIDGPIHLKMNKELNDFKNVNATSFLVPRTGMLDLWFLHDFGVKTLFYAFYCHRPLLHRKIQDDRHFFIFTIKIMTSSEILITSKHIRI